MIAPIFLVLVSVTVVVVVVGVAIMVMVAPDRFMGNCGSGMVVGDMVMLGHGWKVGDMVMLGHGWKVGDMVMLGLKLVDVVGFDKLVAVGEVTIWHFWARLEDLHLVVLNDHRKEGTVVQLAAVTMVVSTAGLDATKAMMVVSSLGFNAAATVEDSDFGAADPVVRDLVVRVVPTVRLTVHRVL